MINKRISELEKKIKALSFEDETQKRELLDLIARLKSEMLGLPPEHQESAIKIAASAEEAALAAVNGDSVARLKLTLQELENSTESFEISHPGLVSAVNSISDFLAKMGI